MRGHFRHYDNDDTSLTDEERLQREARHRAHQRMGFLYHLAVFIPVMLLILAIDVLTPNDGWFIQWVAGIWGGILAIHFLYAFILDDLLGPALERRIFETQLTALKERSRRR
ncbi:MAG: 2TM domain-containing protein [Chloroflexi bacterium]|nr:MAG: 2TM domain-containing protein [Chloroflexota bacterium]